MDFVCPSCSRPLEEVAEGYKCPRERQLFPLVFGIPDFRVGPKLSFESESEDSWAERLIREYPGASFADLLELYESLRPRAPASVVSKRRVHVLTAVARGTSCVAQIRQIADLPEHGNLLEIGCGTGGFLVVGSKAFRSVIGVDISLPRLILAKKNLEENGQDALLLCAYAESLPFNASSFQLVVANDLIEHVQNQLRVLEQCYRVLAAGGALFVATPNRWSLTPEPHVNVWGVGFLPKNWRARYVTLIRQLPYVNITLLNWFEIRRLILRSPFRRWRIIAPTLPPEHTSRLPVWARAVVPIYNASKEHFALKWLVYVFGPLFHVICIKGQES